MVNFPEHVQTQIETLPRKPGVYLMHDVSGAVIYVGKAVDLHSRVRSYFHASAWENPKVHAIVSEIADLEFIVTDSELEALILEANLIKQHRPRYNVRLKDDKRYPYIKITWPEDLLWAEHFVEQKEHKRERRVTIRSGIGYDAHRCKEDRPLVLGGVRFEGEPGLLGHSDADVVCHAICDSLLGALGAGDIGQHFPDSDVRYAGISSLSLLTRVAAMVSGDGWEIENVDAVVIAEAPRIGPRIPQMRRALAGAMGIEAERVNVKAKTTEGLGFVGRREGVASEAICMLRRKD